MTLSRILCTLGLFVTLAMTSTSARAQNGSPYAYGPYGGYWYGSPYSFYEEEHVPYFALHPPVYYSAPVPRTYGYSPFAYPPGTMTPEIVNGGRVEVRNPYAPEKPAPRDEHGKESPATPQGKPTSINKSTSIEVIENPYVVHESVAARQ